MSEKDAVGFELLESTTKTLSVEDAVVAATEHASLENSPTEREEEGHHVKALGERIMQGLWLPCVWATVLYLGKVYRMNGQHSARAIINYASFLRAPVVIHYDQFRAEHSDGMGLLFRQFDWRGSSRSKAQVSGAYQGLVDELRDVPRKWGQLGLEGIAWYEKNLENLPIPNGDDLFSLFFRKNYHEFLKWLPSVVSANTPELNKQQIVAAMYGSFAKTRSGATEFWNHVVAGDVVDDGDPCALLTETLREVHKEKNPKEKVKGGDLYKICENAWFAFRTSKKVRKLTHNLGKELRPLAA